MRLKTPRFAFDLGAGEGCIRRSGQAEIEELGAVACQEDVGGFEVAVNDAQVVKGLQRAEDLTFNCQGLRGVDRVSEEALRQGLALEQLQDEDQTLTFFEDVENLADVGMIHAGQGTRLAPKPAVGFFALACFVNGLYSD